MRRRSARMALGVLVLAACARSSGGARPPREDAPPTAPEPAEPSAEASAQPTAPPPTEAPAFPEEPPADPALEAKLEAYDREHLDAALRSYDELRCFHEAIVAAGEERLGEASSDARWSKFERDFVPRLDAWQKQYFVDDPRAFETSRFASHFLEVHELLMLEYLLAYDERDRAKVQEAGAHWLAVEGRIRKRVEKLGAKPSTAPPTCDPPAKK